MSIDNNSASLNPETLNPQDLTAENKEVIISIPTPSTIKSRVPKPGSHIVAPAAVAPAITPTAENIEVLRTYGRIDSQGKVWRISADGEEVIAQWLAGDEESGLLHFHHKYQEFLSETHILKARLLHGADPKDIIKSAQKITHSLEQTPTLGDLADLQTTLTTIISEAQTLVEQQEQEQQQQLSSVIERKTQIVELALQLAESNEWKTAGDQFNNLQTEWDQLQKTYHHDDAKLWKKFSKAKETFQRRRGAHFSALDKRKAELRLQKENIVTQANDIVASIIGKDDSNDKLPPYNHQDWVKGSQELRALLDEWKKIGRIDKTFDNEQWHKFKTISDKFYAKRHQVQEIQNEQQEQTALIIQQKINDFKNRLDKSNLTQARQNYHKLIDEISSLTNNISDKKHRIFTELKNLEKSLHERISHEWNNDSAESKARAEQFQSKASKLYAQAEKAKSRGENALAEQLLHDAAQWEQWAQAALESFQ